MAFLDKMVQHCCGDCHNGHGISIRDYALDGSNNLARKNTEEEMRLAIDFNTDLSLPVYGFSDQRKYMNNFRFVPVVESPGAAFIVTREGLKPKSFIDRLVLGCGPLLLFNLTAIFFDGIINVDSGKLISTFLFNRRVSAVIQSFLAHFCMVSQRAFGGHLSL